MIDAFDFHLVTRVVWRTPAQTTLPVELASLDATRPLIVTDPGMMATGLIDEIATAARAQGHDVAVYSEVSTNPTTGDVGAARTAAVDHRADALVAVGGGSAIDTAKASAMLLANGGEYADYQWDGRPITHRNHPFIAVPTTAGTGSEVSKVAVITDPGQPFKKGVLSPLMFAHVALIDPTLTLGLPPHLTAATGIDAFVHALEAFTGRRAGPFSDLLAVESLRLVWNNLERATSDGSDVEARHNMMLAATYGGIAMDQAGLGLVHAISGGLCSSLHLHHGLANAMILPYVARFNVPAITPRRRQVLDHMFGLAPGSGDDELVDALSKFVNAVGLPVGLAGQADHTGAVDWDAVADESMRMVMVHNNPRSVSTEDCRAILDEMMA